MKIPLTAESLERAFARDERIHGRARREAEELRASLASGSLDPRAQEPHRSEVEIAREEPDQGPSQAGLDSSNTEGLKDRRLVLSPLEFDEWRRSAPEEALQIGEVVEERERFVVSVALEEGSGGPRSPAASSFPVQARGSDPKGRAVASQS